MAEPLPFGAPLGPPRRLLGKATALGRWLWARLGVGFGVSALFWTGLLLSGRVITTRDIGATHLPWRGEWRRQVLQGWVPFWNPRANGGRPLWADPNSQAAYPLTALFLLPSSEGAMTLFLAGHHLWLMAGLGFLARRAGASKASAAAAGAILATSGLAFSLTTFPNSLASAAWVPWAWGLVLPRPSQREGGTVAALGSGGILGLSFLAGEPVTAGLGLAGALFLCLCFASKRRRAPLLVVSFALVAAPVLVPLLQFFPESARGAIKVSGQALAADALAPRRWLELLFPRVLGTPLGDAGSGFWAAPSFPWQRYYPLVFLGAATLVLVASGIFRADRQARAWVALLATGVVAAALPAWPWGLSWLRLLPGGEFWRFAIKGLQLSWFSAAPLLAWGLDQRSRSKPLVRVGLALALFLPALFPNLFRAILRQLYPASASQLAQVDNAFFRAGLIADGLTNALPLVSLALRPGSSLVTLTFMAVQWPLFFTVHELVPKQHWAQAPPLVRQAGVSRLERVLVSRQVEKLPAGSRTCSLSFRDRLVPDFGLEYGLSYVLARGPDGLEPVAGDLLAATAEKLSGEKLVRLGASLGAQAVLLTPGEAPGGCALGEELVVCLPTTTAPPVYLARRGYPAPDLATTVAWLTSEAFVPGEDVALFTVEVPTSFGGGNVTELPGSPSHRRFLVQAPEGTVLVVNQNLTKGWQAKVDGQAVTVTKANFARMGIYVPAGAHKVELYLNPRPYLAGALGPFLYLVSLWALRTQAQRAAKGDPGRSSQAKEPGR